jgi:ribonuclease T2
LTPQRLRVLGFIGLACLCLLAYRSGALPWNASDGPAIPARQSEPAALPAAKGDFVFYVLALSWSPSYCADKGGAADAEQCGLAKKLGFTTHGLWPQFERGAPQNCGTGAVNIDRTILKDIQEIMPSDGLARHEWQKHGTCSGLSQKAYFDTMMEAVRKVEIPDLFKQAQSARQISPNAVETAFLQANPGMSAKGFAAVCGRRYLSEVRICMTKDLNFRECPEVDRKACRANSAMMPPAR